MSINLTKPLVVAAAAAVTAGTIGIGVAQAADPGATPTPTATTKSKADLGEKSIDDLKAKNEKALAWFEANGIEPGTMVKDGYAWIVHDEQTLLAAAAAKGVEYEPKDTSKYAEKKLASKAE